MHTFSDCLARVSLVVFVLCLSACEQKPPVEDLDEMASETEMEMEEEELRSIMGSEHPERSRLPKAGDGPFTMMVLDDNANPAYARHLLTTEEMANGWISLFDGATLFGWHSSHPQATWEVIDGAMTRKAGSGEVLHTSVPFADFELLCEFKISPGGNGGLLLRSTPQPEDVQRDCLELDLTHQHPQELITGSFINRKKSDVKVRCSPGWQKLRVVAIRNRFTVELNEELLLEYTDNTSEPRKAGVIGLQQRVGKMEFRKVNLKPLTMKSIFNGMNLAGWQQVPGCKAEFTVIEDTIEVKGGLGFLETRDTFQDFIFQTQVRTGAPEINSGFFFRAEPGTEKAPSNGYEVQIHNGFNGTDRDQPNNSGSGAIFRRVDARRVVASDEEWFTMTTVAYGPRVAVWVDGYEVVDWEDTRPPHANPRKGLRLEAGHISLQGHDPTTTVAFRYMKLAEFPVLSSSSQP